MKPTCNSRGQVILIAVSAFLHGIVVGIAGFALWAEHSGILKPNAFFAIFFPFGILAAAVLASLPCLMGDTLTALRRFRSVGVGHDTPREPPVDGA